MSKIYQNFLFFLIFVLISKNINSENNFWKLTYSDEIIDPEDKGEAFLTIDIEETPKDIINFDNTVIIGIDLSKADPNFSAKVHKNSASTKEKEVYKIDFESKTIGKNEFTITLYDYENKRSYTLDELVEFEIGKKEIIIEEIIPAPKKTKILNPLSDSYGENDTLTFDFSLVDSKGNDIIGNNTFIKKLKVLNNGYYSNNAKITLNENDPKVFHLEIQPQYLPLLQQINVEFNGDNDTFNLFEDDLTTTITVSPFYLNTEVQCQNCEIMKINETPLIDIKLYNYKNVAVNTNQYNNLFKIIIEGPLDTENNQEKQYKVKKEDEKSNLYQIVYEENDNYIHSGEYKIKVYEEGILIKEFEFSILPGNYDINGFSLKFIDPEFDPQKAFIDTEFGMELKGTDCFGNMVSSSLEGLIELYFENEKGKKIKTTNYFEESEGKLKIYITSEALGYAKLKMYYNGTEISTINNNKALPEFTFNRMKCSISNLIRDQLDSAILGDEITFYLQCFDKFGNKVKRGGETFSSNNYFISDDKYTSFPVKIKDLKTGNYSFHFIPSSEGNYYINIYLDNELFEKIEFKVEKLNCGGSTPFLCPNKNLCVSNRRDCIEPKNNCPEDSPFSCRVQNVEQCVESQTQCDCPYGYIRCDYMKYCVPMGRLDMCANFSEISESSCQKLKQFKYLCRDGICRLDSNLSPTQKVCPIGKVLCADLSCRDSYFECEVSELCEGKFRCPDQTCVEDYRDCPSTISCQNKKYVCPDGTCVDSEIECEALPICSGEEPYRCHDNLCVKDKNSCSKNVACGQRMALCQDSICRTTCDNI